MDVTNQKPRSTTVTPCSVFGKRSLDGVTL